MRHFFISAVLMVMVIPSMMAQSENLSIAVAVSKQQMTEKAEILQLMKNKLSSAMAESKVGIANYSGIIVSPTTTITNRHIVEGGMRNITIYDIDLSLTVSQVITGSEFNAINITLRGEGYTKDAAILAAIRSLSAKDKRLIMFFSETKTQILDYYRNNVQVFITKAKTLASMQQYDKAVTLLASYPENLKQYGQVAVTMKEIYTMYQQKVCSDILQKARGAYTIGNYEEAVQWLNEIDMSSPCAKEAKLLASQIKQAIDAELAQKITLYQQQMQTAASIEKRRIQAIENIVTSYYKNLPEYYFVF